MENKDKSEKAIQFRSYVRDWGLSHATLEEVFMKITKENKTSLFK
jgi:hypothetical protein